MKSGLGATLFTSEQIQKRISELAEEINRDYGNQEKDLVVVGILKGAFYFLADLTRHLTVPLTIDFLSIGLYHGGPREAGIVRFTKDLDISITGKHVLLVEDIIGTGLTLGYICQHLEANKPASLKICTLLDKPAERLLTLKIDYRCFEMPDRFVVGFGLDFEQKFRNLPFIAEYQREK